MSRAGVLRGRCDVGGRGVTKELAAKFLGIASRTIYRKLKE